MVDYLVRFVSHADPNGADGTDAAGAGLPAWPRYTPAAPALLALGDGAVPFAVVNDTFREEAMGYLVELGLEWPL